MNIQISQNDIKLYKNNIPCKCEYCSEIFHISNSDAYRSFKGTINRLFCSRKCQGAYKTLINTKACVCANCNIEIRKRNSASKTINNFCSQSCAAIFNNKNRTPVKYCKNCPNILHSNSIQYCSLQCQHEYRYTRDIEMWKNGDITGIGCEKYLTIKPSIRRYLLECADNKCSKCGWGTVHPSTGRIPLQINHIDGNAANSSPNNLEVVCPNCHSLTSNFGSLNKNSARKYRYNTDQSN